MKIMALLVAVCLLATGCSDAVTNAMAKEKARILREVFDLSKEQASLAVLHEQWERSFAVRIDALSAAADSSQSARAQERLREIQSFHRRQVTSLDEFRSKQEPADRIFYVHSLSEAVTYYVLLRGVQVIARTEAEWRTE